MKQTIEYYYNLEVDKLYLENDTYHFTLDNSDYYFVPFFGDLKALDEKLACASELKRKNIDVHEIMINISGKIITKIEDSNYLLLKVKNKDEDYNISDLIKYNKMFHLTEEKRKLYKNNWAYLWSTKIDYIEEQTKEIILPSTIMESLDFYLGLGETAIAVVNNVSYKYPLDLSSVTLARKRVYYPNTKLNYFNPLLFLFDLEVRDIAEYIKSLFYYGEDALLELDTYLKSKRLSVYSYNMLLARLIYPSNYFDIYERVVNQRKDSEILLPIIKKSDAYLTFLKEAYKLISKYSPLEKVEYLIY